VSAVLPSFRIRSWLDAVRRSHRRRLAVGAAAGGLLLALVLARVSPWPSRRPGDVVVRRGDLQPLVPLVGLLAAESSDAYGASVPGVELKILWLAPEGALVRPGDRLIEFDPAPFQKDFETSQARAKELEAETDQARLAVEALRLRSLGAIREAEDAEAASEQDLSAFVNSGAPLLASESAHDVEQKSRLLKEAEEKLEGLEPFVERGFISQEEYRGAVARREQAVSDLRLALARHAALVHQTNPDLVRKKTQESESGKEQLELARARSRAEREGAQAALRLSTVRLEQARRQVEEARRKIAACVVTAKGPGLTVHSELYDKSGERRKVRMGDSVWGGTTVVTLPDLSRMLVEGRVSESEIQHLAPGQAVRVRLDAFPELPLEGVLRSIGSVGSAEKNESRTFPATVALKESNARFRPGMIARCTVVGRPARNALIVPIDAIRSDENGSFVFVRSAFGRRARRPVVLGTSTAQSVEVRRGLSEGETVEIGEN
jgi:RND family efflux transporter MFP subunit